MTSVRVASFNILHGARRDGVIDNAGLVDSCEQLDPDLLGLQEIESFARRSRWALQHRRIARRLGARAVFHRSLRRPVLIGAYGVAVVSRCPIVDARRIRLPRIGDIEPAGLLMVTVTTPFGPLTVANTHLSTVPVANQVQLEAVVTCLAQCADPVVLVGDFNRTAEQVRSTVEPALQLVEVPLTYPAHEPYKGIDLIAVRGLEASDVRAHRLAVSDHRAVTATIAPSPQG